MRMSAAAQRKISWSRLPSKAFSMRRSLRTACIYLSNLLNG